MVTLIDTLQKKPSELRHPEKQNRPESAVLKKPDWLRVKAPGSGQYNATKDIVRSKGLHTVCEEAACPNIGECWSQKHATLMIMGDTCTRACAFCNVKTGLPQPLDPEEPAKVGLAVAQMELNHVVITSVDRDDVSDGGAAHFAEVVRQIRLQAPDTTVEILTPARLSAQGRRSRGDDRRDARRLQSQPRDGSAPLSEDPPRRPLFPLPAPAADG